MQEMGGKETVNSFNHIADYQALDQNSSGKVLGGIAGLSHLS